VSGGRNEGKQGCYHASSYHCHCTSFFSLVNGINPLTFLREQWGPIKLPLIIMVNQWNPKINGGSWIRRWHKNMNGKGELTNPPGTNGCMFICNVSAISEEREWTSFWCRKRRELQCCHYKMVRCN
jgi:hypothetical protein